MPAGKGLPWPGEAQSPKAGHPDLGIDGPGFGCRRSGAEAMVAGRHNTRPRSSDRSVAVDQKARVPGGHRHLATFPRRGRVLSVRRPGSREGATTRPRSPDRSVAVGPEAVVAGERRHPVTLPGTGGGRAPWTSRNDNADPSWIGEETWAKGCRRTRKRRVSPPGRDTLGRGWFSKARGFSSGPEPTRGWAWGGWIGTPGRSGHSARAEVFQEIPPVARFHPSTGWTGTDDRHSAGTT